MKPGVIDRLFGRYIRLAERRNRLLLLLFAALALACLWPISQLELHTDMAELLPDQHPAVVALRRVSARQKSSTNLVLLIRSPDAAQNRRFADALLPELRKLVPSVFSEVEHQPDTTIPDFGGRWRWLYAERKELEEAEQLLDRLIATRKNPLVVDLEGDAEGEIRRLREGIDRRVPERRKENYFTAKIEDAGPPFHVLGLLLWRRGDGVATLGDHQTVEAVQRLVDQVKPGAFHKDMQVDFTGNIAASVDEHNAVRDDLTLSTGICVSLVLLVIYLYFRRVALLLVIGAPAVLGLLLALVLARYSIGSLNANTAFLLSIILGNGINSPIILLARYGEERQRGEPVGAALATALSATLLATGIAMASAGIAYGCLLLTTLRGLSQFGLVGGAGMLLVWIVSFLLVPPLVLFGERLRPGLLTPRPSPLWHTPFALLGRLAARRSLLLGLCTLALLAASVVPLRGYLKDPLEWRLENLRRAANQGDHRWDYMFRVGIGGIVAGYIATDGIILVDRPEQADVVAQALRDQDAATGYLKEVRTLRSVLPKEQPEKLLILGRIRDKIDRHRELMSEQEWQDLQGFRPPDALREVRVEDLPRPWLESFTEVDGTRGRLIGLDANTDKFKDFDGHAMIKLSRAMQVDVPALGQRFVASSFSTIFASVLEIILQDQGKLTGAALCGVTLLVLLAFGWRGALPVLLSVLIGVVWLGGLLGLIRLKINFVNFVALPITLGVGADYAANIWARLRREGLANLEPIIASTGSAVALCSLTTIIGYSSLLLAGNRALKSFGLLADLGEVTCLMAALLAMPSIVRWVLR